MMETEEQQRIREEVLRDIDSNYQPHGYLYTIEAVVGFAIGFAIPFLSFILIFAVLGTLILGI